MSAAAHTARPAAPGVVDATPGVPSPSPPSVADVEAAAERIRPYAVETPLLRSEALDRATGARVFVKAEALQRTGSFKFRGAFNLLSAHVDQAREAGVVAYSSGNYAQGIAEAARLLRIRATIVMPADAPAAKLEGVASRGAAIVRYDRARESREAIAEDLAHRTGALLARPYDDPHVIAGQGTTGLEVARQLETHGARADDVVCCVGGGGLIAGIAVAMEALSPHTRLWAAEPAGFDDTRRSLSAGTRRRNAAMTGSLCDAIVTPEPGALTFAINGPRLAGGLVVTDGEAIAAMGFALRRLKIALEPGGAVALAAVLLGRIDVRDKTVVVIASGGNADPALLARAGGAAA